MCTLVQMRGWHACSQPSVMCCRPVQPATSLAAPVGLLFPGNRLLQFSVTFKRTSVYPLAPAGNLSGTDAWSPPHNLPPGPVTRSVSSTSKIFLSPQPCFTTATTLACIPFPKYGLYGGLHSSGRTWNCLPVSPHLLRPLHEGGQALLSRSRFHFCPSIAFFSQHASPSPPHASSLAWQAAPRAFLCTVMCSLCDTRTAHRSAHFSVLSCVGEQITVCMCVCG